MKRKTIIKIFIVIAWASIIFLFSNQKSKESLDLSKDVLYKIVEVVTNKKLNDSEKKEISTKYTFIIRKTAHFFLYFVLALLLFILLKDYIKINYVLFATCIIFACIYSITDEVHQLFIDGRSAMFNDVLLDTSAAMISTYISYIRAKKKTILN